MADLQTLYNSLVDTLMAMARVTETGSSGLDVDELLRRLTQAIRTNIPDKADELSEGSSPQDRAGESAAYAMATQAMRIATRALEEATVPEVLPDGRVYTNEDDLIDGFLDDEITVTPLSASIHEWLKKSVIAVGGGDNNLLLEHNTWDAENLEDNGDVIGDLGSGNGVTLTDAAVPNGVPYISYTRYFDQYDANNHSQVIANPAYGTYRILLPDYLVKVEAGGAAGYLKNKVSTTPVAGEKWLKQSVVDDTLLLEHSDLLADLWFTKLETFVANIGDLGGGVAAGAAATGFCSIEFESLDIETDAAGHAQATTVSSDETIRWLALPTTATSGDTITWNGTYWEATESIPDRPVSGDYILTSQDGVMSWVELDTFACP